MASVTLKGIAKAYREVEVLTDIDLTIADREFVVFVGPSGCGKSTLLRLIAGLEDASRGDILIDGERVNARPPAERGIAMVFQSYALYPHMTVFQNMAFGLRRSRLGRAGVRARVEAAAEALELTALLDRLPRQLSGGQRQRVAIGRAIVRDPKVFLFDEPLSNLDTGLRAATRLEIQRLHRRLDATMIYVTHDQVEAMTLADRIVVLNAGRVEQVGTPLELYHRPANLFVATFLGSPTMNLRPMEVVGMTVDAVRLRDGSTVLSVPRGAGAITAGETVTVGIRAEDFALAGRGEGTVDGSVELVEALGESHLVHVREAGGGMTVARLPGDPTVSEGQFVSLRANMSKVHIFKPCGFAAFSDRAG
ncbi:ABC transporter ATP-binding protein [Acuticoccus sediminis]|uniref:ABC transporter ATP-binding protein n=1 Tax=Acuticoccus sediminis TaxID=2184697 RepID=UPI001CFE8CC8|nr:sn-glycerol-3-phosphate ABC transporter ATP-binding protein UgpC [Acuticoccus sediminis]